MASKLFTIGLKSSEPRRWKRVSLSAIYSALGPCEAHTDIPSRVDLTSATKVLVANQIGKHSCRS